MGTLKPFIELFQSHAMDSKDNLHPLSTGKTTHHRSPQSLEQLHSLFKIANFELDLNEHNRNRSKCLEVGFNPAFGGHPAFNDKFW
jgi:hypothetical protein